MLCLLDCVYVCVCVFMCPQIYEIGGGSGTCAKGIMDYIMLNAPTRVYNNMTYTYVLLKRFFLYHSWDILIVSRLNYFMAWHRGAHFKERS